MGRGWARELMGPGFLTRSLSESVTLMCPTFYQNFIKSLTINKDIIRARAKAKFDPQHQIDI